MIRLRFVDVGRAKKTWEVDAYEGATLDEQILASIRKSGGLMSGDIGYSLAIDEDGVGDGHVFAGVHTVGRIEVIR